MSPVDLRRDGAVWILTMQGSPAKGGYQNMFNPPLVAALSSALDTVARADGPCALVIASQGKFFSTGHDVAWLEKAAGTDGGRPAMAFIDSFYRLLYRILTFPVFTVAAMSGHAVAGGLLLAMSADFRVMRRGRGFACMNEIDMALLAGPDSKSNVKPGMFEGADAKMTSVLAAKLPVHTLRQVLLLGSRYDADAAKRIGLVDAAAEEADVLPAAVRIAREWAPKGVPHNRRTVTTLKTELVAPHVAALLPPREAPARL
eukprot:TRINITY_DN55376_c0_g1_i1.p1 TRINITY_DN55376_c0_g1~~TRINITY_DN55376_c0_g1_i1.p1  ORF type:complete len:284 (+),score=92.32 TRINITY_DN55376_c0_g1_i1:77-853(+)